MRRVRVDAARRPTSSNKPFPGPTKRRPSASTTTGGRALAYTPEGMNYYSMREFLVPFERTASLCNMTYLPPFVVHGTISAKGEGVLERHAKDYADILTQLRDGAIDPTALDCDHINEILTRDNTDA